MKFLFTVFLSLALFTGSAQTINEQWVKEHYIKKEYTIAMRDGVKLFTAVYAPKEPSAKGAKANEKHPFLMIRTPYSLSLIHI